MDFRLTIEQTDIKQAAIDFAKGEFDPDAALEYDKEQKFPLSIWKKASKLGFIGVNFPEQYGGQDCGLLEYVLIAESFCQQDSGIGMALTLSDFGSGMILRYGWETLLPKSEKSVSGEALFSREYLTKSREAS